MGGQKWPPTRRDSTTKVRNIRNQTMEKPIGLAKAAYQGAPRPLGDNVLGNQALEVYKPQPKWNFKSKKLRRQEIIDSL